MNGGDFMIKVGKIINKSGKVLGLAVESGIKLTGGVAAGLLDIYGKKNLSKSVKKNSEIVGTIANVSSDAISEIAGFLVDESLAGTVKIAKYIGKNAVKTEVRIYGDAEEFFDKDKFIDEDYNVVEK